MHPFKYSSLNNDNTETSTLNHYVNPGEGNPSHSSLSATSPPDYDFPRSDQVAYTKGTIENGDSNTPGGCCLLNPPVYSHHAIQHDLNGDSQGMMQLTDRGVLERDLQERLDGCCTGWGMYVRNHIESGSGEIFTVPVVCGERNCPRCYQARVNAIKQRMIPLWESFRPGLRTTHIILSFGEIPLSDMTHPRYLTMRSQLRLFFQRLRRAPENVWGYETFELKWNESRGVFTPHVHLFSCGYGPSAETMQSMWNAIHGCTCDGMCTCGKFRKAKVFYSKSPKEFRDVPAYHNYLKRRRDKQLDYLARRCAGVGLVMGEVTDDQGKPSEVPLGSIPTRVYLDVVKHMRVLVPFGKMYTYRGADGKNHRSTVPRGLWQLWQQRRHDEELEKLKYTVFFLGHADSERPFSTGGSTPPPWAPSYDDLLARFLDLGVYDDQFMEEGDGWHMAFSELQREHYKHERRVIELRQASARRGIVIHPPGSVGHTLECTPSWDNRRALLEVAGCTPEWCDEIEKRFILSGRVRPARVAPVVEKFRIIGEEITMRKVRE